MLTLLALGGAGFLVGLIAGMFGVGGGFLMTPLLVYVFGLSPELAVGSSLCQQVGSSITTLLRFRRFGIGERRMDILMLAGSLLGVEAGGRALLALGKLAPITLSTGKSVPATGLFLNGAFVVLLGVTAILTMRSANATEPSATNPGAGGGFLARVRLGPSVVLPAAGGIRVSAIVAAFVGLLLGFLSGLMGVGGGVLLLPILLFGYGFGVRVAAGTGVVALVASVSFGAFRASLAGNVSIGVAASLLFGASIGAVIGPRLTKNLSARTLRVGFSLLTASAALALSARLVASLL